MLGAVTAAVAAHGYWIVGLVVALESAGLPLPGETTLVSAAIYAGTTHRLDIALVVLAAALGGIAGDNLGFWIGRRYGYDVLVRRGASVGLNARRLRLGRALFDRHGGKVVLLGRFVALLRVAAALLAGVACMPWRRFVVFNAAGAVAWASAYGFSAYAFGREVEEVRGAVALVGVVLVAIAIVIAVRYVARQAADL